MRGVSPDKGLRAILASVRRERGSIRTLKHRKCVSSFEERILVSRLQAPFD